MKKIRAYVSWVFFQNLFPFNAELLNGNAMLVRACGAKPSDGSIQRSKEYLLFGNGIATLLPRVRVDHAKSNGYIMEFTEKCDPRGIAYWEVQSVSDQTSEGCRWRLEVSHLLPSSDAGWHIRKLIQKSGHPSQFIYLSSPCVRPFAHCVEECQRA